MKSNSIGARYTKFLFQICLGAAFSSIAWADSEDEVIEEQRVTGSYLKRSMQEQPNPVEIYSRSDWQGRGSPQIVDVIRTTPSVSGSLNISDQYTGSGVATGLKTVNIRGLGATRTLVLMNGKRMAVTPTQTSYAEEEYSVDIGSFPSIAMERIELLKSGGAVSYGSDAVAGVWNYITRDEFEGLEIEINRSFINESEGGDQTLGVIWGGSTDTANLVASLEYESRDQLNIWRHGQVNHNGSWPFGLSSFGNPGTFIPATMDLTNRVVDPGCGKDYGDGGFAIQASFNAFSQCGFSYLPFGNVIDPQDRIKFLSQFKIDLGDGTEVYGEAFWSKLDATYGGSPSYPPVNPGADYFTMVPLHNPGLADLIANDMTDTQAEAFNQAGGARWWGRSLAAQGPAVRFPREHTSLRLVGGAKGYIPFEITEGLDFDMSVIYSEASSKIGGFDVVSERFNAAIYGMGGTGCRKESENLADPSNDSLRGDASAGCYYFNPASSSITAPIGSDLYNEPALRSWFLGESSGVSDNRYAVAEFILNGETPSFELDGGYPIFALGAQYRWFETRYTPTGINRVDTVQASPFHFLGVDLPNAWQSRNWSIFGEIALPLTTSLDLELGFRHENYSLDAATKPKIAGRWDVSDSFSVRASLEQVFRAPLLPSSPRIGIGLYRPTNEWVPFEIPVPKNIEPEESTNFNIGMIITPPLELTITLDYYRLSFDKPFARESETCPCVEAVYDDRGRLTKVVREVVNGEGVITEGLDFDFDYITNTKFGIFSAGLRGNYVLSFEIAGLDFGEDWEAAGKYNSRLAQTGFEVRPMPKLKFNGWTNIKRDRHNFGLNLRYVDGMEIPYYLSDGASDAGLGSSIDAMLTLDAHYSFELLPGSAVITLSAHNLGDERAPLVPHEQGYDAYSHYVLGRVLKVGFNYRIGQ